jgi:hypothetical protein
VEIQGLNEPLVENDIYAHEIHTDVEEIGIRYSN